MKNFVWYEKYRPQTLADCILPKHLEDEFKGLGEFESLILEGGPGVGKSTVAIALCKDRKADYFFVNGSLNGNIDTLRNEITDFVSTVSLNGGRKYVIIDEADNMNQNSTQLALRGFIEQYSKTASFIMTVNYLDRLISPLHSRENVINFYIPNDEKPMIAKRMLNRLEFILKSENIEYDRKVLTQFLLQRFPDFRMTINNLQRFARKYGKIDVSALQQMSDEDFTPLIQALKARNYDEIRKWVGLNSNENRIVFRKLFDYAEEYIMSETIPQLVLILGEYQYKDSLVADKEINMSACLVEIMKECRFK